MSDSDTENIRELEARLAELSARQLPLSAKRLKERLARERQAKQGALGVLLVLMLSLGVSTLAQAPDATSQRASDTGKISLVPRQEQRTEVVQEAQSEPALEHQVAALPADTMPRQARALVEAYLRSIGATFAYVAKSGNGELEYAISYEEAATNEQVRGELAALLENFSDVEIQLQGGRLEQLDLLAR